MTYFKKMMLAFAVLSASSAAQSDDSVTGLALGKTSDKIRKSSGLNINVNDSSPHAVTRKDTTWGAPLGQQSNQGRYDVTYGNVSGSYNGVALRQEHLLGSYDLFYPVGGSPKLFGGATDGMTHVDLSSSAQAHVSANYTF